MKTVFNLVLVVCALALIYVCYDSITGPIHFDKEKTAREQQVIARLIDIRKAQHTYATMHGRQYADDFNKLIDFVKNQKLPIVMKEGQLSDKQLEDGLTERKAVAMINKAKQTNNWKEVEAAGLMNFKRDTMWVPVMDTLFHKGYNADSLRYIPFGNGAMFEMAIKNDTAKSGAPIFLYEVKAPYDSYLKGLNEQELINLKDRNDQLGRYNGLMIGSLEQANNGAGNWE